MNDKNKKENKKLFNLSNKIDNMKIKRNVSPGFKNFVKKCDILKERANKILENYINLSGYINFTQKK